MSSTLIIGGTGFIGIHIVKKLIKKRTIKLLVRDVSKAKKIFGNDVQYCVGDITDYKSVVRAMHGCEVVYHVAGIVSFSKRSEELIYENNVVGVKNVCKAVLENNVRKMIFTSSAATIGKSSKGWSDENTEFNLWKISSPYKKSKVYAEREVYEYIKMGAPIVIVNPTVPIGGNDFRVSPAGGLVTNYLKRKKMLIVKGGMNFVAVEDVARAHILAEKNGKVGERYIIGSENLTLEQFYNRLNKSTGVCKKIVNVPYGIALMMGYIIQFIYKNKEPPISQYTIRLFHTVLFYDLNKAKKELGFKPQEITGACEAALRWFELQRTVMSEEKNEC